MAKTREKKNQNELNPQAKPKDQHANHKEKGK